MDTAHYRIAVIKTGPYEAAASGNILKHNQPSTIAMIATTNTSTNNQNSAVDRLTFSILTPSFHGHPKCPYQLSSTYNVIITSIMP
jgi:hypothetical protein